MQKYSLNNGLTIIEENRPSDSVTVQVTIKVGSNDEKDGIRGISHFIEHMLFEGTKNRKNAKEISNEIEALGGEFNAYTDNIRTCFYVKVPKQYFEKSVSILADIIINPLFQQESIEKERNVILKEINIFNDDPRHYQWILFHNSLFINHPAKYPAFGNEKDVKKIKRVDTLNYYKEYYNANNTILTVAGNVKNCKSVIRRYFRNLNTGKNSKTQNSFEPKTKNPKSIIEKRKLLNSYMVLGYKSVPRTHKDSYILDVVQALLGKGQSGLIFDAIRNKKGLAYEVGVHHEPSKDFGFFAIYLSTDKKNIPLIKKLILQEFSKLKYLSDKEIQDAIGYVQGKYILDNEDTRNLADKLAFWELIEDARLAKKYLQKIRAVKKKDILRVAKEYLTNNFTLAIIRQK